MFAAVATAITAKDAVFGAAVGVRAAFVASSQSSQQQSSSGDALGWAVPIDRVI